MASEQLLCSICLDVFNDPVSTPCGHNFCKICLKTHWDNSHPYRCPNCNKTFKWKPDLKINTTLREIVDEYKKKIDVFCDMCTEGKLKAVKSCLVCQTSYCETHLESHLRVSGLRKHKLIDPVKDLQDYICPKHERPLELFCRDDQTCVCLICTVTDHKNHNNVPMRESQLQEMIKEKQKEKEVIKHLEQEITELKKRNVELEMIAENLRVSEAQDKDLIRDLKKEITKLKKRNNVVEKIMEKQRAAEEHDKDVITDLEQEISELKKRNVELEMIAENQSASEMQASCLISDLKLEITDQRKKNLYLKMNIEKQEASEKRNEDVRKHLNQEIFELKKRNIELQKKIEKQKASEKIDTDVIKYLHREIYELKRRNHELEVIVDKRRASETQDKCLIKNLKRDITELMMVKQMQMIEEKQYEDQIKNLNEENTDLRRRYLEQVQKISDTKNKLHILQEKHQIFFWSFCVCFSLLVCMGFALLLTQCAEDLPYCQAVMKKLHQFAVELTLDPAAKHNEDVIRDLEQEITELKTRNHELKIKAEQQRSAETQDKVLIRELKKEITDLKTTMTYLKRRNTEQKQKISNTENGLRLLKKKHHIDLQKSLSESCCGFWLWSVVAGASVVLCVIKIQRKRETVDVTLDPDTAHPDLILSDDKKQVNMETFGVNFQRTQKDLLDV